MPDAGIVDEKIETVRVEMVFQYRAEFFDERIEALDIATVKGRAKALGLPCSMVFTTARASSFLLR